MNRICRFGFKQDIYCDFTTGVGTGEISASSDMLRLNQTAGAIAISREHPLNFIVAKRHGASRVGKTIDQAGFWMELVSCKAALKKKSMFLNGFCLNAAYSGQTG